MDKTCVAEITWLRSLGDDFLEADFRTMPWIPSLSSHGWDLLADITWLRSLGCACTWLQQRQNALWQEARPHPTPHHTTLYVYLQIFMEIYISLHTFRHTFVYMYMGLFVISVQPHTWHPTPHPAIGMITTCRQTIRNTLPTVRACAGHQSKKTCIFLFTRCANKVATGPIL